MFRFVATMAAIGAIASSVSAATIVDQAVATDRLSTLVAAVKAADLVEALSGDGPVTVFAPDNDAFSRLDDDAIAYLLTDAGKEQLTRILLHHVVPGRLDAATLAGQPELTTLAGTTLSLEVAKDRLLVNDAVVETADISASNGMVHIIDRVLLPPVQMTSLETLLVNAIDRGAPLFNEGSPEGCAAVYATALDAVVAVPGFGLSETERVTMSRSLERIALDQDATERAWAYRGIMDALLSGEGVMQESAVGSSEAQRVVFDFNDPSSVRAFGVVLDGVMGGVVNGACLFRRWVHGFRWGDFAAKQWRVFVDSCDGP